MRQLLKVLLGSTLGLTALQAHGQTVSSILNNEPDGFVGLASGVVLFEIDETSVICQIDTDAAKFANVAKGQPSDVNPSVCVPLSAVAGDKDIWPFDGPDIDTFIDGAEGYVNVTEGVIMVEGETDVALCQIPANDALFERYERGDDIGSDGVICLALDDLERSAVDLDGWRNFQTFVDLSEGYTELAPGLVLVEAEDKIDVRFCEIATPSSAFASYLAEGDVGEVMTSCVRATVFDDRSRKVEGNIFSDALDRSIGYARLRDNVLMVETDGGSQFCEIAISRKGFAALAADPKAEISDGDFVATCVSTEMFDKTTTSPGGETLEELIDRSLAYEYVDDNVLLIELEDGAKICRVEIDDNVFLAHSPDKKLSSPYGPDSIYAICITAEEYDT